MLVRPELNIAKNASIFFPASTSLLISGSRTRSWIQTLDCGGVVERSLRVSPSEGFKAPSLNTYIVLLALFELWRQKRTDDGNCQISYRQVLRFLGLSQGARNVSWVEQSLLTLRETSFCWEKSFSDEANQYREFLSFTILSRLECLTRISEECDFRSRIIFKFDESIQRNLEHNKTKPVRLDALQSIKGGYARAVYIQVDVILSYQLKTRKASNCHYQRLSKKLFEEDLGISIDKKYRHSSRRRVKLLNIAAQLDGKIISAGARIKASVMSSKDLQDCKICLTLESLPSSPKKRLPVINKPAVVAYLMEDVERDLRVSDFSENKPLYKKLCQSYPEDLIYLALSEFKADIGENAVHRGKAFVHILKRIVRERGLMWVTD